MIPISSPTGNRILDALPAHELHALEQYLRKVDLGTGEVIYNPHENLSHVYFPVSCVLSEITLMQDGAGVEIGTIGREGFSGGLAILLGSERAHSQNICQVPGSAMCMPLEEFRRAISNSGELYSLAQRYARSSVALMGQSIACNRLHTLSERCARWLLLTHDRVGSDQFLMTQEFLATMLGVHRPAVSIAAGTLQQAGFIHYQRGRLNIVDREGLESASCECYEVANGQINGEVPSGSPD